MKFINYCTEIELYLQFDKNNENEYDFSYGIICQISNATHLAVRISQFYMKKRYDCHIVYALFDWSEADFDNKEDNIKRANEISETLIIPFANMTITKAMARLVIPLAVSKEIQNGIRFHKGTVDGLELKSSKEKELIRLDEYGDDSKTLWAIFAGNKHILFFDNHNVATNVFAHLSNSLSIFIGSWLKSMIR